MPDETKATQPPLSDVLDEMRNGFARMEARFDKIESRLDAIEKELTLLNREVRNLSKRTLRLEVEHEDFEERLTKLEGSSGIQ